MVEPLGFLLKVIAKDFYAILASIEPQRILDLSKRKGGIHAKSGGNLIVDYSHVGAWRIRISLFLGESA